MPKNIKSARQRVKSNLCGCLSLDFSFFFQASITLSICQRRWKSAKYMEEYIGVGDGCPWAFQRLGCSKVWADANSTMPKKLVVAELAVLFPILAVSIWLVGDLSAGPLKGWWHLAHPAGSVSLPRTISIVSTFREKSSCGRCSPKPRQLWDFPESRCRIDLWQKSCVLLSMEMSGRKPETKTILRWTGLTRFLLVAYVFLILKCELG